MSTFALSSYFFQQILIINEIKRTLYPGIASKGLLLWGQNIIVVGRYYKNSAS